MNDRPDPFALAFDALNPGAQPGARMFDDPLLLGGLAAPQDNPLSEAAAPPVKTEDGPGFYLLDDAAGRFVIDHEIGVVSISDDNLLTLEHGAVHPVRIRVVENSGAAYELNFRLRITGHVPQMAGGEENDALSTLAAPALAINAPEPPAVAWTAFEACSAALARRTTITTDEHAAFGAPLATTTFPSVAAGAADLTIAPPPAPAPRTAIWTH